MKKIILIGFVIFFSQAYANELTSFRPKLQEEARRGSILLGLEGAFFSFSGSSFNGLGINLGYRYPFFRNWAVQGGISQAFSFTGGFGFLYTSFSLAGHYAIFGNWNPIEQTIEWQGKEIIQNRERKGNLLSLTAGVEQFLFSGNTAVYPAPGAFGGVLFRTEIWGLPWSATARAGAYASNGSTMSAFLFQFQTELD
jgi:hypothetical protein